jgi:hypothetical protein
MLKSPIDFASMHLKNVLEQLYPHRFGNGYAPGQQHARRGRLLAALLRSQ